MQVWPTCVRVGAFSAGSVDLGESFHTSVYRLLANFGFDTAENEPCKVCPLSLCREQPSRVWILLCRISQVAEERTPLELLLRDALDGGDNLDEQALRFSVRERRVEHMVTWAV